MELEQQVATLEQSKKLKELEIKIDTCFSWVGVAIGLNFDIMASDVKLKNSIFIPAPTAEEIAELLPEGLIILADDSYGYFLDCARVNGMWIASYINDENDDFKDEEFRNKSLTQALASMLIWLIVNNHINPKELR